MTRRLNLPLGLVLLLLLIGLTLLVLMARPAAGQTVAGDRFKLNTGPCTASSGSGSPEGVITGKVCDTYAQTNSPYDRWRKISGTGNTGWIKDTAGTSSPGTVSSVDATLTHVTFTGGPITTSGILAGTFNNQAANNFFIGPTTGAAAAPGFRALVNADIPTTLTPTITSLTLSGLTAGRVVYTSTGGLLTADGALTYNGSTFQVGGVATAERNLQVNVNGGFTGRFDNNGLNFPAAFHNRGITAAGNGTGITFFLANGGGTALTAGYVAAVAENATFTGATADSALTFATVADQSANTERMRISSAGNVGIGTAIFPSFNGTGNAKPLTVAGSGASTTVADNDVGIVIVNTNTTTSNTSGLHFGFQDTDGTPNYISSSIVGIHGARTLGQYSTGQLAFLTSTAANTAPSEKMRITAAGDVGIGTTTMAERLNVNGNISVNASITTPAATNLTLVPTGDLITDPVGNDVLPATGYDINLGMLTRKYLMVHAAELWVETLVAQNTIATIGGRILVLPTNILVQDLAAPASVIHVKYNNFTNGDRIYLEANGTVEFMAVASVASGTAGDYSYTVTRNLDGTGANDWTAGDAIANTGQAGNGFLDLYSVRGVKAGTEIGPTLVCNVRNSATFNDWSPVCAIGNMNGLYNYGVGNVYGMGLGPATGDHITVDPSSNGIRFRNNTTTLAQLASSVWTLGNSADEHVRITSTAVQIRDGATVYTELAAGAVTVGRVAVSQSNVLISSGQIDIRNNTTSRIRLAADGSGFVASSNIAWDTAGNATIAGWAVSATTLTSGTGAGTVTLTSGGAGTAIAISAGNATPASAPFRVTAAGALTATSADITGTITATTGTIGGWTIGATALTAGTGATTVAMDSGGTNPAFYAGSATPSAAPFRVTNAGALTALSGAIAGWTISTTTIISGTGANQVGLQSGQTSAGVAFWAGGATPSTAPFQVRAEGSTAVNQLSVNGTTSYGGGATLSSVSATHRWSFLTATNNTVTVPLAVTSQLFTGTAAAGLGAGMVFTADTTTTANVSIAQLQARWTTTTHGSQTGAFDIQLVNAGAALATVLSVYPDTGGLQHTGRAATATVNVDQRLIRWQRPQTPSVKYANTIDFVMGSYGTSVNAQTLFQINMNNGATDTPDTTVLSMGADGNVSFASNINAGTGFSAGGTTGATGSVCTAFKWGLCTAASAPEALFSLAVAPYLEGSPIIQRLRLELEALRAELAALRNERHEP